MSATSVLLVVGALATVSPIRGVAVAQPVVADAPCHFLMTESECKAFQESLKRARTEVERKALLDQHHALIEDRVQACWCTSRSPVARNTMEH